MSLNMPLPFQPILLHLSSIRITLNCSQIAVFIFPYKNLGETRQKKYMSNNHAKYNNKYYV